MFKSNLFAQLTTAPPAPLWNDAQPQERAQAAQAAQAAAAAQMVDSLVAHDDDSREFLSEQVASLERGIDDINSDRLSRQEQDELMKRLSRSHDVYALARRMSVRLRVLLQTNERLSASATDLQQRQTMLLEREILDWD